MADRRFCCPCCGFLGLESPAYANLNTNQLIRGIAPPYSNHFGMPSYDICKCCGFEFGNDDDPGTAPPSSFEEYLADWELNGCVWFDGRARPSNWSLSEQLELFR